MFPDGEKRFLSLMGIPSGIFGALNSNGVSQTGVSQWCPFAYSKHFAF